MLSYRDIASPFDAFGIAGLSGAIIGLSSVSSERTFLAALAISCVVGVALFLRSMNNALRRKERWDTSTRNLVFRQLTTLVILLLALIILMLIAYEVDLHESLTTDLAALAGGVVSGFYLALFLSYVGVRMQQA